MTTSQSTSPAAGAPVTKLLGFQLSRLVALLIVLLAAGAPLAAQVNRPEDIDFPSLPPSQAPIPERVELANGMVVMLLEDHEMPLVDVRVMVRTGTRFEPPDKIGLAGLFGGVMRTGGTTSRPSDELDDLLEIRAATIETSVGTSRGWAYLSCLADHFPEMLEILADVLRNPAFEQPKIDVARNRMRSIIARRNDEVNRIAGREFRHLLYGADSPYSRVHTYATLAAIERDDLLAWHRRYYHPNRMILGLSGDFDRQEALKLVREVFGDWPAGPPADDPQPSTREPDPGVFYVEKNDVTQSVIRIGHLGITRDNPDFFALELMNEVFGGSFASRLFTRVRSQKALAYNVGGGVGSHWDHRGIFRISLNTKTATTAAGIDALLEEAANLTREPPTDDEVEQARSALLNSFVFRAVSTLQILHQQMTYEYFGYPLDWQDRYRRAIEQVTTAEVQTVAEKYIHPDKLVILVVGPAAGRDRPLSDFGEVREVDITIPPPPRG